MNAIAQSIAKTETFAALLDAHLSDRKFMAGDAFAVADIALGCAAHRWLNLPITREKRPNIDRWHATLQARPATAKVLVTPVT